MAGHPHQDVFLVGTSLDVDESSLLTDDFLVCGPGNEGFVDTEIPVYLLPAKRAKAFSGLQVMEELVDGWLYIFHKGEIGRGLEDGV